MRIYLIFLGLVFLFSCQGEPSSPELSKSEKYDDLVTLFQDWRSFENPPITDGAPDYTAASFLKRQEEFLALRRRLNAIKYQNWPIEQQVDWHIVWAEMNGYEFNVQVLKPWERDPAYYKSIWMDRSDVPAHEGPTHHRTTEVWTYSFPLTAEAKAEFLADLRIIPPLHEQAKKNLTGNAKDLWIAGIRDIEFQLQDLDAILEFPGVKEDADLTVAIEKAKTATAELAQWLKDQAPLKTGPSGIGKENYTWYLQNVHLVPLTWEDEVMLLERELARAWSNLKLEEHRNRKLPPLQAADSPEAYLAQAEAGAKSLMKFLEEEEIVSVKDYFDPALREHLGEYFGSSSFEVWGIEI